MGNIKKKDKPKNYLSNKEFLKEIIISKQQKKLTYKAEQMIILLGNKVILRFRYSNPDDKQDCLHTALLMAFKGWHNFNPERSTNAFAYFTEVIKRGLAYGWNELYKCKGDPDGLVKFISIESSNDGDGLTNI